MPVPRLCLSHDVIARTAAVRRRRCGTRWLPPPANWQEIIRRTWPALIRHPNWRVPGGWCDLMLAMADHLEGRQITIIEAFEDLVMGRLQVVHTWRRGVVQDDESNVIIHYYESLSASTCRECGDPGEPVRRGTGRLATMRVLCEQHRYGDVGV